MNLVGTGLLGGLDNLFPARHPGFHLDILKHCAGKQVHILLHKTNLRTQ